MWSPQHSRILRTFPLQYGSVGGAATSSMSRKGLLTSSLCTIVLVEAFEQPYFMGKYILGAAGNISHHEV